MKVRFLLLSLAMLSSTLLFAGKATTGGDTHLSLSATKGKVALLTKEQKEARAEAIKTRVLEIKSMDKSNLSREDRKALRKELRDLRREYREVGTRDLGIVILGGALAAVLILLILA